MSVVDKGTSEKPDWTLIVQYSDGRELNLGYVQREYPDELLEKIRTAHHAWEKHRFFAASSISPSTCFTPTLIKLMTTNSTDVIRLDDIKYVEETNKGTFEEPKWTFVVGTKSRFELSLELNDRYAAQSIFNSVCSAYDTWEKERFVAIDEEKKKKNGEEEEEEKDETKMTKRRSLRLSESKRMRDMSLR